MEGRLDQRQAKSFGDGAQHRAARLGVENMQIGIGGVFEPKQTAVEFLVLEQALLQRAGVPAWAANDHIAGVDAGAPEALKSVDRNGVALARLERAYAQKIRCARGGPGHFFAGFAL